MCLAVMLLLYYLLDTDTDITTDIWLGLSDLTFVTDTDITPDIDISYTDYRTYTDYQTLP